MKRIDGDIANLNSFLGKVSGKIDRLDTKIDRKINELNAKIDTKIDELDAKIDAKIGELGKEIKADIRVLTGALMKYLSSTTPAENEGK